MTDLVKLALIAAVAPTITSLANLVATLRANTKIEQAEKGLNTKIEKVEKGVNGLKDELVQTTARESFAAGMKHEKENPS